MFLPRVSISVKASSSAKDRRGHLYLPDCYAAARQCLHMHSRPLLYGRPVVLVLNIHGSLTGLFRAEQSGQDVKGCVDAGGNAG